MTDFDLDRLGDVWRQAPDPREMEKLRRTAEAVARHARRAQLVDAALAIAVSVIVLVLALSNPKVETLAIGAAAIALMLSSSIRQRRLRALELKSLAGTAEEMLDQSIDRLRATVKRTRLALLSVGPAFVIGIGFGFALNSGAGSDILATYSAKPWAPILSLVAVAILGGGLAHYFGNYRRDRAELERLVALREAFRKESENTES